jgi:non-heme chloroperoxidase
MSTKVDKINTGATRAEYIEVETNVTHHITDAGEGRPIVLIHGWALSEEMDKFNSGLIKFASK